jgi:hypothetical protein
VLTALTGYELARKLITPNWVVAEEHARDVLRLEQHLHVAWELPLQRFFLRMPDLVWGFDVFYVTAHFAVTAAFFVWLYRRSPDGFSRFRDGFLVATAFALAVHWSFPTAPPRLAGLGLEDTVRELLGLDIGSRASSAFTDPVAAVPSLHAGWAFGVGVGLLLYARSRTWRFVGAVYPLVTVLAVVVTGNHFLFDAFAGIVVMVLGFAVTAFFRKLAVVQFAPQRGVEQSGSSPGS